MSEREEPIRDLRELGRALGQPSSGGNHGRDTPPGQPRSGGQGDRRPGGRGGDQGRRPDEQGRGAQGQSMGLPTAYLRDGYFDADGQLRPELIVEHARQIAESFAERGPPTAALRRFFGMTRRIEGQLAAGQSFAAVRPALLALKPFVTNACTRDVVPPLFRDFIERNVDLAVKGQQEFLHGFLPHFQYVVAYFPRPR